MMRIALGLCFLVCLAGFEAGAAVTIPGDEPPIICDQKLPVKEELSWRKLWPELGLARAVTDSGSLPNKEVPAIARAIAGKYKQLNANDTLQPDAFKFLLVLEQISTGGKRLSDVDWKVDSDLDPEATFVFPSTGEIRIRIVCPLSAPLPEYMADIARLVPVFRKITDFNNTAPLEVLNEVITMRERQATNLLRNGLTMTPWEMKLNEYFLSKDDAQNGFKQQLIFFRPSGGMEMNARSRAQADLNGSLAIEPIGFIRYLDTENYDKWWGASALFTSSTRGGVGYGVLLRYGNYTAGVSWHKADSGGGDDAYLFLGLDLYNLLDSKRPEMDAFVKKYKGLVGKTQ